MADNSHLSIGKIISGILAGCWQEQPRPLTLTIDQVRQGESLLASSGCSCLAWHRICHSGWSGIFDSSVTHRSYRFLSLQSAVNLVRLKNLFSYLAEIGLDPILGKGWAIARLYPYPAHRPYGDFDLYLNPKSHRNAIEAFTATDAPGGYFDWHSGFSELDDRREEELYRRSQVVKVDNVQVRVFGQEDQLRLLCLHMLHHGAWRPLWLCDVAVAWERRTAQFDWDYFLDGDQRRTEWIICTIGLAHEILGADISETPLESRAKVLPPWLAPTVLKQWGMGQNPHGTRIPMHEQMKNPRVLWNALKIRWPNGIEASVDLHAPFNNFPRLPLQIADCFYRTYRFIHSLVTSV